MAYEISANVGQKYLIKFMKIQSELNTSSSKVVLTHIIDKYNEHRKEIVKLQEQVDELHALNEHSDEMRELFAERQKIDEQIAKLMKKK